MYSVTFILTSTQSARQYHYKTRDEAMRAANGMRSMLPPREGGRISVSDPEGRELQTWIEHIHGAHFTQPGGFRS